MIKQTLILILLALVVSTACISQTVLTNDDGIIHVDNNAVIHVEGDVVIQQSGVIDNSGTIRVQNDWINNSTFNVFINSSTGEVILFGTNQQIAGSTPTKFYDLIALTTAQKSILVNTQVENKLDITDSEILLNSNTLHLFNTHPDSLLWNTGFISGDTIGGYFLRSVDRSNQYIFPVGSSSLLNTYRAVSFTPSSADSTVIGVRLADRDASFDITGTTNTGEPGPFDLSIKTPLAVEINQNFYHHVTRFFGSGNGSVKIYYFDSDEPLNYDYNEMVVWDEGVPRWNLAGFTAQNELPIASIGFPDKSMTASGLNFSNEVYALTSEDKIDVFIPQIFSPNGDGLNDFLFAKANRLDNVLFIIYNRWGEKVFESTDIQIGWDGTFRGVPAQEGVYVYYLEGEIEEGGSITKKGDITLVR